MCQVLRRTWWPVLLVFNNTFNNVSGITYDMLASFIGINATVNNISALYLTYCWKWCSTPIKLATMFYAIPDILLKVSLNTNKTGHHDLRYNWHIVESGIQPE
jgi:hypothetical protein